MRVIYNSLSLKFVLDRKTFHVVNIDLKINSVTISKIAQDQLLLVCVCCRPLCMESGKGHVVHYHTIAPSSSGSMERYRDVR